MSIENRRSYESEFVRRVDVKFLNINSTFRNPKKSEVYRRTAPNERSTRSLFSSVSQEIKNKTKIKGPRISCYSNILYTIRKISSVVRIPRLTFSPSLTLHTLSISLFEANERRLRGLKKNRKKTIIIIIISVQNYVARVSFRPL